MHLDAHPKEHVFDSGISKAGQEKSVRKIWKHGNSDKFWESFQDRATPLLLLVSFPLFQTPLVSSPWWLRPPSISGRPPSVWGTKLIQGHCGWGTCMRSQAIIHITTHWGLASACPNFSAGFKFDSLGHTWSFVCQTTHQLKLKHVFGNAF